MSTLISVRLHSDLNEKLEMLSHASHRSKSFLAAEAIAAYLEAESWQISEIEHGIKELNAGRKVDHDKVDAWLRSWGKTSEMKRPK